VPVTAAASPGELAWTGDEVVLLTMKSQDAPAAIADLAAAAPPSITVVCAQNGVANERAALRRFEHTLAMCVVCPATHLVAGVVRAESHPCPGILDLGRYPHGSGLEVEEVAMALCEAGFDSQALDDVMRWKYRKLLVNLGNAVEAICTPPVDDGPLLLAVREEGVACLAAAGIDAASAQEDRARRGDLIRIRPVNGEIRGGSSTWQSLERRSGQVETEYLNGEIVLLGRLHGVPTPANALVQRVATRLAREHLPPRSLDQRELLGQLAR
jgi:2-dehydropantoate 2-reductase